MIARLLILLVAAPVVALSASGCGTGADRDQATAVTTAFLSALDSHRGASACAQLSAPLRMKLAQDEDGSRCPRAVAMLRMRGAKVRAVRVYATSARIDLADGESVFLGRMREGWRIQALGCRPRLSGPYDCEEQA